MVTMAKSNVGFAVDENVFACGIFRRSTQRSPLGINCFDWYSCEGTSIKDTVSFQWPLWEGVPGKYTRSELFETNKTANILKLRPHSEISNVLLAISGLTSRLFRGGKTPPA